MGCARLIQPFERQAWQGVLSRCGWYDVYHLPEYYLAIRSVDDGMPFLLAYEEDNYVAALPILVRRLESTPDLGEKDWWDATSAYGYPGLLTNCRADRPGAESFRTHWQIAIQQLLRGLRVVTLFVRQHPLFPTTWMWHNLATVRPLGQTVVLDLQRSEAEQVRVMRHGHRNEIREAARRGITVAEDSSLERLGDFRRLYEATMRSVNADAYYFFPSSYYDALHQHLHGRVKLFFAARGDELVAASLFFHCGDVLQYHLSGGNPSLGRERALGTKLIIDTVRRWGAQNGFRWLHLGGGLGARQDSLFHFKAGFSDLRCDYYVVNYIVEPEVYNDLVRRRFGQEADTLSPNTWFPLYRYPLVKRAA